VFPTCEHITIDPTRPQKSWRTAWRKLIAETARQWGREAAQEALDVRRGLRAVPTSSIDQYGATMAEWFGVGPAALPQIFPNLANFPTAGLGFLG
jgi:hypothetical protein